MAEFWADKVKRLKKEGRNKEVLRICRGKIPFPGAFGEISIALRKLIREKRKQKQEYDDLLKQLYENSVVGEFFGFSVADVFNERTAISIAKRYMPKIDCSYDQIGYEEVGTLNVTDIKWIVEKWGEPSRHADPTEHNSALYKELERELEAEHKKEMEDFYRGSGFSPEPIDLSKPDRAKYIFETTETEPKKKHGCLVIMLAVIIAFVFSLIVSAII